MGGDSPEQRESFDRVAAEQRAKLTREQWTDYQKRYAPWEDKLISFIDDPSTKQDGINRARDAVETTYDSGLGQYKRQRQRLGELTPFSEADKSSMARSKVTASVQATNDARRYADDRREKVQTSGLSSASGMHRGNK